MGIASGISHLCTSFVELIQGIIGAIVHFFQLVLNSIVGVFQGVVNFVEGTLGFAFHNFFLLGTVAAAVLAYLYFTQQRQVAAPKNKST
ncbi:hypothetical protein F5X96DRAFT_388852 [Biscogniauxia mediterranea]|nr:hypothetical protein F5X96DRAFT_388852 [Biscogniauxia mediterranea]